MCPDTPDLFDQFHGGVRATDPDTSWQAAFHDLAQRVNDRVRSLKTHYYQPCGLTDFELAKLMGRQQTSAGKRRGELRDMGLLEDSDTRRPAPSGSQAIVWVITPKGRWVCKELARQAAGRMER